MVHWRSTKKNIKRFLVNKWLITNSVVVNLRNLSQVSDEHTIEGSTLTLKPKTSTEVQNKCPKQVTEKLLLYMCMDPGYLHQHRHTHTHTHTHHTVESGKKTFLLGLIRKDQYFQYTAVHIETRRIRFQDFAMFRFVSMTTKLLCGDLSYFKLSAD